MVGGDINHDMRDTGESTYQRLSAVMDDSYLAANNVHINNATKFKTIFAEEGSQAYRTSKQPKQRNHLEFLSTYFKYKIPRLCQNDGCRIADLLF